MLPFNNREIISTMSSQETEAIYFGIGEAERERLLSIRRQHETLKAALLEKKAAREVACVCCLETGDKWHMAKLPCEHMYCRECSSSKSPLDSFFSKSNAFSCIRNCLQLADSLQMLRSRNPSCLRPSFPFIRFSEEIHPPSQRTEDTKPNILLLTIMRNVDSTSQLHSSGRHLSRMSKQDL